MRRLLFALLALTLFGGAVAVYYAADRWVGPPSNRTLANAVSTGG
jgi:hypothetical protein